MPRIASSVVKLTTRQCQRGGGHTCLCPRVSCPLCRHSFASTQTVCLHHLHVMLQHDLNYYTHAQMVPPFADPEEDRLICWQCCRVWMSTSEWREVVKLTPLLTVEGQCRTGGAGLPAKRCKGPTTLASRPDPLDGQCWFRATSTSTAGKAGGGGTTVSNSSRSCDVGRILVSP